MRGTEIIYVSILGGLLFWLWWKFIRNRHNASLELTRLELPQTRASLPSSEQASEQQLEPDRLLPYTLASELVDYYQGTSHPDALLAHPRFVEGVELLNSGGYSIQDLIDYYHGSSAVAACMAMEAYARRSTGKDVRKEILANINGVVPWTRYFVLRALNAWTPADESLIGKVLAGIDPSWRNPFGIQFLREFIKMRLDGGEAGDLRLTQLIAEEPAEFIRELVEGIEGEAARKLWAGFNSWRSTQVGLEFLSSMGRIWSWPETSDPDPIIETEAVLSQVAALEALLLRDRPRSALLVGDSGVGKSTIARVLGKRLQEIGWVIFEAGHTELIAGKVYVGEVEERFRKLYQHLGSKRKILWYIPDFHAIAWAGRHQHSSTSALDYFLPRIEQGEIAVLGETQPLPYEKVVQSKPGCRTAMEMFHIQALGEDAALELARQWVRRCTGGGRPEVASEETLREAWHLTQQYLADKSAPGNLLQLLKLAREQLSAKDDPNRAIVTISGLIQTLTQLTGLPASILDDRESLDLKSLRKFFESRVLGQPDVVDCLVDRVAMIKAAVGDPSRPQGVFLFVGPTGTGKTEIAKALREYLFGSASRMIRLDMSEFQGQSLEQILGDGSRSAAVRSSISFENSLSQWFCWMSLRKPISGSGIFSCRSLTTED
jgi:ATP-dependent Clp protease ATP-binding subunit ClpC